MSGTRQVRSNRGAAGVDGQTISEYEDDLQDNLYKLWNRLSSGSYFPPAVKEVEIPKRDGKMRTLGIPTISDRIAQSVVRNKFEKQVEPYFHPDSYAYRKGNLLSMRYGLHDSDAGNIIGCWSLT